MHWLTGSSPETALNAVWNEVGALTPTCPSNRDFLAYEFEAHRLLVPRHRPWRRT
ncbi:MAG: hypothetical protein ACLSVD_17415 [Eggerthellaceae bacterium]